MRAVVDRRLLGSERHLAVEMTDHVSAQWTDTVEGFHLSGRMKGTPWCLDTLLKLEGLEHPIQVPQCYQDAARIVLGDQVDSVDVPWRQFMPEDAYRDFWKNSVHKVARVLDGLPTRYFQEVWCPTEEVFRRLRPVRVDTDHLDEYFYNEPSESQRKAVRSFSPAGVDRTVGPPKYNRFGTRTGRLTVLEGPQILTIKKSYKCMLESVYREGVVVSMDFVGLEARVAFLEADPTMDEVDVYEFINTRYFRGGLPRDVIKQAVLCELFGMGAPGLALKLGVDVSRAQKFMARLRELFKTEELLARLKHQFVQEGFIRNRFGRRVVVPEMRLLLNSYVQSTGVDVALLGFKALTDMLAEYLPDVRPLMVLHDDLMVDCPRRDLERLQQFGPVLVPGYEKCFYVKVKTLAVEQLTDDGDMVEHDNEETGADSRTDQ